jgi:hypothetical protein
MDAPRTGNLSRINAAGERFEESRAQGDRPRFEDFLVGCPAAVLQRSALVG